MNVILGIWTPQKKTLVSDCIFSEPKVGIVNKAMGHHVLIFELPFDFFVLGFSSWLLNESCQVRLELPCLQHLRPIS